MKDRTKGCSVVSAAAAVLLFSPIPLFAGNFFSDLGDTLKDAGNTVAEQATELSKELGITDDASAPQKQTAKSGEKKKSGQPAASGKTEAAQPAQTCADWDKKVDPLVDGERALHVYPTDDAALHAKWEKSYQEAKSVKSALAESGFSTSDCGKLRASLGTLDRYMANYEAIRVQQDTAVAEAAAVQGQIVFSSKPLDPENPGSLSASFTAGDYIYGLILAKKSWAKVYETNNNGNIRVDVSIDGKKIHAQFVNLQKPEYMQRDYLVFDIAPEVSQMTAYSDSHIIYGKSTATLQQGPNELSYHLGQLAPGKHTVQFSVDYFGRNYAKGSFTVEGQNYTAYATLHNQIAKGVADSVTLPPAKMENPALAKEMRALLEKAGWKDIYRINIVDKDWWIDRVSGGDSAVQSRHMAAAALAKGADGNYYFKKCTFHQDKLLSGGFGPLYLSHQGDKVPVAADKIDM